MCVCVCIRERVCVCVCLSVCLSLTRDSSETIELFEVIIVKLGTVTASDMIMHQLFIILTLTFIQDHTLILIMKIINV